jgi:hypothetical protein
VKPDGRVAAREREEHASTVNIAIVLPIRCRTSGRERRRILERNLLLCALSSIAIPRYR